MLFECCNSLISQFGIHKVSYILIWSKKKKENGHCCETHLLCQLGRSCSKAGFYRRDSSPLPSGPLLFGEGGHHPSWRREKDPELNNLRYKLTVQWQHFSQLPLGLQGVSSQFFFLFIFALLAWSSSSDSSDGYTLRRKKNNKIAINYTTRRKTATSCAAFPAAYHSPSLWNRFPKFPAHPGFPHHWGVVPAAWLVASPVSRWQAPF